MRRIGWWVIFVMPNVLKLMVNAELAKLDNRQSYHFDKEFKGELGVSQDLLLKPPVAMDPPSTLNFQLDIKGCSGIQTR